MSDKPDLLIEIGTEELPPKALAKLSRAFEQGIHKGLQDASLAPGSIKRFATPRRLALLLTQVPTAQEDQETLKRGPALEAAFGEDGCPTKAAQGFARSCGVEVEALEKLETDKGTWLVYKLFEKGRTLQALLPDIVRKALAGLPIPKRMRWGSSSVEFVRPVHWVVLLYGDAVIKANILGVDADRYTRGHRFHHPEPIYISEPAAYAPLLETEGHVLADHAARCSAIKAQVIEQAKLINGNAVIDDDLLDEVTALVEWPVALSGMFDKTFLDVPTEALISSMQDHQKYFPVKDDQGKLLPHFITVANIESSDLNQVRTGNERVIRPRLADAKFFWDQDLKQKLADRADGLRNMVFQKKLGTLYDKQQRLAKLATGISGEIGGNPVWAQRAAEFCKCDLLSQMVYEFPELQGVMGRYYAQHDGEPDEIAQAIEEHYWPAYAGDKLPATKTGQALALADRIDTLTGIFAIGQQPTGAKDPFGLRRSALGVVRILIEQEIDLDLEILINKAAINLDSTLISDNVVPAVFDYIMERLRAYYSEQGVAIDQFEAVLARRPTRPLDFHHRIEACKSFHEMPEAISLAAANKRIRNILRKAKDPIPEHYERSRLQEAPELQLADTLDNMTQQVTPLFDKGDYNAALKKLAALRDPVDDFFDQVMVMADDKDLRINRLALLQSMNNLFLRVADFSHWQS